MSGVVDDVVAGLSERVGAQLGEVGGFGVVGAQEAIVAFDGAFLPGAVGVAVVNGDAEGGFVGLQTSPPRRSVIIAA